MSELERIGSRVDNLVTDLAEVKSDVRSLKADFKIHTELVKTHVAGDNKIISEIQPLMQPLKDIVKRAEIRELAKQEREQKLKKLLLRLTVLSVILGSAYTILKISDFL